MAPWPSRSMMSYLPRRSGWLLEGPVPVGVWPESLTRRLSSRIRKRLRMEQPPLRGGCTILVAARDWSNAHARLADGYEVDSTLFRTEAAGRTVRSPDTSPMNRISPRDGVAQCS